MRRSRAAAVAAVLLLAAGPVIAAPAPGVLSVAADELQIDAARGVVVAEGRVRVSDGRVSATAPRATVYRREGRAVLAGGARASGPDGVLEGREITVLFTERAITRIVARDEASLEIVAGLVTAATVTLVPSGDAVVAEGGVRLFTDPDVISTGARLVFRRAAGTVALTGGARVQNADGVIDADRIDGARRLDRVTATGNVHAVYRDLTVRSRTADVLLGEKRAVFTGEVRLRGPDRTMTSERVTVWYGEGRALAEGPTWIRLEPQP
ncbi:MAG: LptA/OstA family protein [Armatimonadota bacterium]|nr:LptA/OstA family protein [Armatimonadota bacterium]MDR7453799.1 LptA/OstA family protein [Armatimonadota bacterium]MDR7455950.1 LptA/OstA family protein [Armatimonadota bacterium]MDR7496179.1 LptA/OstA family protein [Armatimonadota bacterium]MDR7512792.1 LptA/OstA family protein [Armatimonadota bacterium]